MRTHAMGEMTVKEIREYLKTNKTIIVPYGVVEQHGYHLPLSMDIHNAEVPSYILAEKLGCIVAPPLNYCFSGGQLPGTINVRPTTFCAMMCDIVEALARQGFENILIFPGHGGTESLAQLKESLRILKWINPELEKVMIMILRRGEFWSRKDPRMDGNDFHAGWVETSSLLDIDERFVRNGYKDLPDSDITDKDMIFKKKQLAAMGEYGHMGMPRFASKEIGRGLNQNCIESICEAVINFYNRTDYRKYDDYFLYKILPLHIGFLKIFGKVRRTRA